jgi:putative DNA primase/helicase
MATKHPTNNAQADLANLFGARFVRTSECERGSTLSQARLKAITAGHGSRIWACRKFENPFSFPETHKLWIDTNPRPNIRDVDDKATFNRLHAVPFVVVIPETEKDTDLGKKLEEEREGIFAQLVWGARDWYAHGLGKPREVSSSTEEWKEENDNLAQFVRECCEIGEFYSAGAYHLYSIYKLWAERSKLYVQDNKKFAAGLQARGFIRTENRKGRRYGGLKLKPNPLADSDEEDEGSKTPDEDDVPF